MQAPDAVFIERRKRQLEHQLINLPEDSFEREGIERAISHLYGPGFDNFPDLYVRGAPQTGARQRRRKGRQNRPSGP